MSPIAKRLLVAGWLAGCLTVALAWVLFWAWLAPTPDPPRLRLAPECQRPHDQPPRPEGGTNSQPKGIVR